MEKKNIVIIHPVMCLGGEERILINMLNALDYERVDVTLWLQELGGFLENKVNPNVHIKHLDYKKFFPENTPARLLKQYLKSLSFKKFIYSLFFILKAAFSGVDWKKKYYNLKAYGLIDNADYDLMIIYHSYTEDLLYWGLTRFKAKKRALWIHGQDYFNLENDLREPAYNMYDHIFCICNDVRNYFCTRYPNLKCDVSVFYNIQDIDGTVLKSGELCDKNLISPSVISIGRVTEEKGFDLVPPVVKLLLDNGIKAHWYIVGDGPDREKFEKMSADYCVTDYVHFLGAEENPFPYVRQADIFVLPTRREGYCTSTIEAKILKKPVITTDVCGMKEQFIDGVTGVIIKDNTPETLYYEIKKMIENSEYRQSFIDNLNDEKFTVKNDLSQLYELLE